MRTIRTYIIILGILSFSLVSCNEDFLQTLPTSAQTEASFYKNVDDLESILFSCYSMFTDNLLYGLFAIGNVGSDDSEKGGEDESDQEDLQDISMSKQISSNIWSGDYWKQNYKLIAKCNTVVDKSEEVSGNAEEIEKIVDQAKFFRAYALYQMVTLFGDVPLPKHFLGPDELNLERTEANEVFSQIERDLDDAKNLPPKSESLDGRITRGAVYALLGKVYMWQKEYKLAIEAYETIIQSEEYRLVEDFGLIHRHEGENCEESILEFQQALGVDGGDMFSWMNIMRLSRDRGAGGWGFDNPTQDLINEFEAGDPRIIYTAIFIDDVFPTPESTYVVENDRSPTKYTNRKAWIPHDQRTSSWFAFDLNWRYCRYAEVLLFYAEALNEDNQPEQAKIYLNMIRERARNTPVTDPERDSCAWDLSSTGDLLPDITTSEKDLLREAIYKEQRVELAMEGHRRWILLRTDRFKEGMEKAKGAKGCFVNDHELFFPIPENEIILSNGKLSQNPGY